MAAAPTGLPPIATFTRRRILAGDGQARIVVVKVTAYSFSSFAPGPDKDGGVYRCGYTGSQQAYESAYDRLFTALEWVSGRLEQQRYLVARRSPKPISGCSSRWFASTPSTTAVQVRPKQAVRAAGAVGLCARPVPDARFWRYRRLRPDQAALLGRKHPASTRRGSCAEGSRSWLTG